MINLLSQPKAEVIYIYHFLLPIYQPTHLLSYSYHYYITMFISYYYNYYYRFHFHDIYNSSSII